MSHKSNDVLSDFVRHARNFTRVRATNRECACKARVQIRTSLRPRVSVVRRRACGLNVVIEFTRVRIRRNNPLLERGGRTRVFAQADGIVYVEYVSVLNGRAT